MDSEQIIALFEEIGATTDKMVEAARKADWDQLAALELVCARHIDTLRQHGQPSLMPVDRRARKVQIIQRILAHDREIRHLVEPWMAELALRLKSAGAERKLHGAYGKA